MHYLVVQILIILVLHHPPDTQYNQRWSLIGAIMLTNPEHYVQEDQYSDDNEDKWTEYLNMDSQLRHFLNSGAGVDEHYQLCPTLGRHALTLGICR
jgi:hypothetical protein